ncbi:transketolase [Halodesulfovibrio sp.]|jgi:transketolase|uniref:transketolase n=1 Tax=Halodesulfovibrio sp. TaxID=1912772 RepID=UPI0025D42371|nr:transketolase [Halodesulfovibrio sp.]MCT4626070.1 transketolase [Halodesulfovibrio sp.]
MPSRKDLANAVRALSMDAVQKANSGHPGAPMGMADIAEVLWNDFLKHNPSNPAWANRDRFVLSNGHASMLIYSLLHLSGYDLSIEEIKNFRQMGSKTPGHPEYGMTPGVELTTGPLGQGIATAVGMAVAEKALAAHFNRDGFDVVDHFTYVFMGDGCLMEGISHEACSFAGTLGLGKLIAFWDDNGISIDGKVDHWFDEDTAARYEAYGWHVIRDVDGHNPEAIKKAVEEAKAETEKPSLICCRTIIGFGAPHKQGTSATHGAPLGDEEIAATRKEIGWDHPAFEIPADVAEAWDARERGAAAEKEWDGMFASYQIAHPELSKEFIRRMAGDLPESFEDLAQNAIDAANTAAKSAATRKDSPVALNAFGPAMPELLGGSADLTGSVGTKWAQYELLCKEQWNGNYMSYGVREFGMGAMMNGMALHGGIIPYAGTFLVFSDYAKNAIRLSALMGIRTLWVLTHDSIGLGEDGPTHQPVEHLAGLRLIPNCHVWRPCDTVESLEAWKSGIETKNAPSCFSMSRQTLPFMERTEEALSNIKRGGYILRDCEGTPECILIASGSEVGLVAEAYDRLTTAGRKVRVVSMPCTNVFDAQDAEYKESVLPSSVTARVAVEAAAADFWYKYVGLAGRVIGMTSFGESAPAGELFKHFGFTVEHVVEAAEETMR